MSRRMIVVTTRHSGKHFISCYIVPVSRRGHCRETWEEIGLDLADKEYLSVGRLDDREITTSLGKRLLMILSPFGELKGAQESHGFTSILIEPVFLQVSPISPPADLQPVRPLLSITVRI